MITNLINETSVWLDQLEDEGIDVSFLRLLCTYNYLSNFIVDGNGYEWGVDFSWGNDRDRGEMGVGDTSYADFLDFGEITGHCDSRGQGFGYGYFVYENR